MWDGGGICGGWVHVQASSLGRGAHETFQGLHDPLIRTVHGWEYRRKEGETLGYFPVGRACM